MAYELSKEKHVLRHMRGRQGTKVAGVGGATGAGGGDAAGRLVLIDGRWRELGSDELQKQDIIQHLQVRV